MNKFEPTSPCYGCVNEWWGCPAYTWDLDGCPVDIYGNTIITLCYSDI